MELSSIKGIGPTRLNALRAVGICSLRDLLYTLPVRYEDHHTLTSISDIDPHSDTFRPILVQGTFSQKLSLSRFHGLTKIFGNLSDGNSSLRVCWYNQPWLVQQIQPGQSLRLYGKLTEKKGVLTLQNPSIIQDDGGLEPVYRSVGSITAKTFRKLISEAVPFINECCPETIPESIRLSYRLCDLKTAIIQAHFPENEEAIWAARRRIAFEKALLFQTSIRMLGQRKESARAIPYNPLSAESFWSLLPYLPTKAQKRVLDEILIDIGHDTAMSRMVQGDVGCGKTVIAFGAIYASCKAGFQVAMMAPTEILAGQHYQSALEILEPAGIHCRLLTGSTKAAERRAILNELASGECQAIFGTHALISRDVIYNRLGLVITDEQHRFGVRQRSALQNKGKEDAFVPHVLVMSATPIPRTLALILYGDLDISIVDELPPGRIPVRTRLVPRHKKDDMYQFAKQKIAEGQQVYIVHPLVEDSEEADELLSATSQYEEMKESVFHGIPTGLVHGAMKEAEKDQTIELFREGKISVLFSTTVIEVGVNVPNASIMIIENAERFGLSQLHQLRGRVGRGCSESWCFLSADPTEKLKVFCSTNDGFVIAQKDLELRGPGDLTGTRQSGIGIESVLAGMDISILEETGKLLDHLMSDPSHKEELLFLEHAASLFYADFVSNIALN